MASQSAASTSWGLGLTTYHDRNGAFHPGLASNQTLRQGLGTRIQFTQIQSDEEAENISLLFQRTMSREESAPQFLYLKIHGSENGMRLSENRRYSQVMPGDFPKSLPVLMQVCEAGADGGIAERIAEETRGPVYAPRDPSCGTRAFSFYDPDLGPVLLHYDFSSPPRLMTRTYNVKKPNEEIERSMIESFEKAAAAGDPLAQFRLAYCLEHEIGIRPQSEEERLQNQARARSLLHKAAEQKLPQANLELGRAYKEGAYGIEINEMAAFACFIQASIAGLGEADFYLGISYAEGFFRTNLTLAKHWMKRAVEKNISQAYEHMASYEDKSGNKKAALKWMQRASDTGISPDMSFKLAMAQYKGTHGLASDIQVAGNLFLKAAHQGHAEAMYYASQFEKQRGNQAKANSWMKKSADNGFVEAEREIGLAYAQGTMGLTQNISESKKYLAKAAAKGDAKAMLGLSYLEENARNLAAAGVWLKKAADAGLADAEYECGLAFQNGSAGLLQDKNQARIYFEKALKNDHPEAAAALQSLLLIPDAVL